MTATGRDVDAGDRRVVVIILSRSFLYRLKVDSPVRRERGGREREKIPPTIADRCRLRDASDATGDERLLTEIHRS